MTRLRGLAPALLATVFVALASWPVGGTLRPSLDLDGSWQIALRQAFRDGIDFGPGLLYTYGPLGFLREPMLVYPWSARLALAWGVVVQLLLAGALLWALWQALRSRVAAVLLAIPLAGAMGQEPTLVIGFVAAVALAAGRFEGRHAQALALGLGALTGVELLGKLNTGVTLLAFGVVALATVVAPRKPLVLGLAAGVVGALATGWIATGQSLTGAIDYATGALAIISGYSTALYFEEPGSEWELPVGLALIVAGFVVAWRAGEPLPGRARWGPPALWGVLAFTSFKTGFVRHDSGHANIFFATMLGGITAFGWARHRTQTAWLVGALFALALVATNGGTPRTLFTPLARAEAFADQVRLLSDGSATNAAIEDARAERAEWEAFDGGTFLPAIGNRTVHVEPTDAGLVWSQRLRWHPLPVFQAFQAYTAELDERNAAEARSPDGPDVIMRQDVRKFENGNPVVDSPETAQAMLCHFRPAGPPEGNWLMLERSAPRCGRERELETVEAKLGVPARVPPAPDGSSVVLMRIEGMEVGGLERLRSLVYRALPREVVFADGRRTRLAPGNAAGGIILRVPRSADHPGGFRLDQASDTITLTKAGREGDLRLRFSARSIR